MATATARIVKRSKFRAALIKTSPQWSTQRNLHHSLLETLEPRHLMAAVAIANDDSAYYTSVNTDLVVTLASTPAPLLANDFDIDGGTLAASVVASPTSGSLLSFGSNGIFTYRPSTGFQGIDTFTYKVSDGSLDSNTATISIAVGTRLLAKQNMDNNIIDSDGGGLLATGGLKLSEAITPDQRLIYRSDSLAKPIIAVETQLAPGGTVPTAVTAQLTFNGVAGTTYSYSTSGLTSGQALRFALQADGTALSTGMYGYSVSIGTTISGTTTYQTFTGQQAIVNRASSEYGANWWLAGLDRVVDSAAGALLVRGNGDTLWFKKTGSTYLHAAGDNSYSTLVKNGTNTFTLTAKTGEQSNFSTLGLLTSRVDNNSNTVSYAYADRNADGIANELISITDPFGRITSVNYTSSKVSSVAHYSGRTTTLTITGGNLMGYTLTDPDGAGPLAAPAFAFSYATAGKISSRTDAVSYTTSYSFGVSDGRLRTITHPDTKTWQLIPSETVGLPTATSGNTLKKSSDVKASITDERSNLWKVITDRFGLVTQSTTALGFVTVTQRNADGLPVIVTAPDPDGVGPLSSSVTKLGYNSLGDLTHIIAPDGGITIATFSSTLHRQLSTTDPVGRTTSSTYDVKGNLLTSIDGAGYVTTYVVNSRGLPTSITAPDPDGVGPLPAPVTTLAYDSYMRLVTLTNPDTSTQTFTYNTADQTLTAVDELGKTNSWGYDSLGRQTTTTNRVAATTTLVFDALSRPTKQTDALGNVTDTEYNSRGWVSKVIYPDPDGAGPLTRPTDNRAYDANGNLLSQGEAAGMFTAPLTATFDADNRQISKGDPTSPSITENWYYDNAGRLTSHHRAAMSGTLPDQTVLQYDPSGRVVRQTVQSQPTLGDPLIRSDVQFVYNAAGEFIAQTDGRGYTSVTTYNSRGLVATETAPDPDGACSQFGLIVSHSYDDMGRETSVDRGFGRVTTLDYNNRSWVTKVTKPDPDGAGALTAPIYLLGYNLRGDQTTLTDPLGNVTTTVYDNQQRATSTTYPDPDGVGPLASPVVSQTYNALDWVTSTTDARGGVTNFTYDNVGRVLTQTQPDPDGAGPLGRPVTTNEYDAVGLSKVTDPLGNATSYVRDGNGRVTQATDAQGGVTDFSFDTYGNLLTKTDPDPDGAGPLARPVTEYRYDSLNRLTLKVDALNKSTQYSYDIVGNLISLKDPDNNTTNFAYDGWNRQVLDTNALSKSQSKTYDVAGNLKRTVDRSSHVIQFDYDALDRQTTEKWQQSSTVPTLSISTTQEGGAVGEQQSIGWSTYSLGLSGTFTITQNGQTTSAIAWNASESTIQSALESLASVGAGNVLVNSAVPSGSSYNRTIALTYRNAKAGIDLPQTTINTSAIVPVYGPVTPFGTTSVTGGNFSETQAITLANASGGTWRLAYNGEITGPLSPSITAAQLKTALDSFALISSVTVTGSSGSFSVTFGGAQAGTNVNSLFGDAADATNGSTQRTITTVYDANDRVTSVSDPSATIASTFDNLGRATGIVNTIAGLTPTVTLNQAFDAMGNRTQLTAKIGTTNDFKNTYQFDALNRLTDIVQQSQSGGNAVTSKHITQVFDANSLRTSLARYQSTGTTNAVASSTFTFDTLNRLTGIAHKQGATNLNTYTYTFDGLSRPTSVVSTAEGTSSYSYDTISQVTAATHTGQSNESYGFDANGNRNTTGYTVGTNNQTTAGLGFTFTYDDQGNRLTRTETSTGKVQSYEWDFRNRLTAVIDRNTSGGAIVQRVDYEYDAYNRLVKRSLDADGAGPNPATTQYWAYDEGINAVLQFDGSSSSNLSHRYLWSDRVDELFADEQVTSPSIPGNTLWGLADNLGTLRDIADFNESTGVTTIANHRTFNANGKLVAETNAAVDLLFAFTGKQLDESTGLQHNLFRWYDANLGQWLSEDPLGFAAGDENVRRYVGNSQSFRFDPSGLVDPSGFVDPPTVIVYPLEWHHEHPKGVLIRLKLILPDGSTTGNVTGGGMNVHLPEFGTMLPRDVHRLTVGAGIHCLDADGSTYDSRYLEQLKLRMDASNRISQAHLEEVRLEMLKHYSDQFETGTKATLPWPTPLQDEWAKKQTVLLKLPELTSPPPSSTRVDVVLKGTSKVAKSVLPIGNIYMEIRDPLIDSIKESMDMGWGGFIPALLRNLWIEGGKPCLMNGFQDLNDPYIPRA